MKSVKQIFEEAKTAPETAMRYREQHNDTSAIDIISVKKQQEFASNQVLIFFFFFFL